MTPWSASPYELIVKTTFASLGDKFYKTMYIGECGRLLGRPSRSLTDLFSLYHSLEDVVKTTLLSKLERSLCFFRIFLEMFLWFVRSKNKL